MFDLAVLSGSGTQEWLSRENLLLGCAEGLEKHINSLLQDRKRLQQQIKTAKNAQQNAVVLAEAASRRCKEKEGKVLELVSELDERQSLLATLEEEIARRKKEADNLLQECEGKRNSLMELESTVHQREDATEAQMAEVLRDRALLQELKREREEVASQEDALRKEKENYLEERFSQLHEANKACDSREAESTRQANKLNMLQEHIETWAQELKTTSARMAVEASALRSREEGLMHREADVLRRETEVRDSEAVVEEQKRRDEELQGLQDMVNAAVLKLDKEQRAAAQRALELTDFASKLEDRGKALRDAEETNEKLVRAREEQVQAREREAALVVAGTKEEVVRREEEAQEIVQEAEERLEALESSRKELQRHLEALRQEERAERQTGQERMREQDKVRSILQRDLEVLRAAVAEQEKILRGLRDEIRTVETRFQGRAVDLRSLEVGKGKLRQELEQLRQEARLQRREMGQEKEKWQVHKQEVQQGLEKMKQKFIEEIHAQRHSLEEEVRRRRSILKAERAKTQKRMQDHNKATGQMQAERDALSRRQAEVEKAESAWREREQATMRALQKGQELVEREEKALAKARKEMEEEKDIHERRLREERQAWEDQKREVRQSLHEKSTDEADRLASLELALSGTLKAKEAAVREKEVCLEAQMDEQKHMQEQLERRDGQLGEERRQLEAGREELARQREEQECLVREVRQEEEALEHERRHMLRGFEQVKVEVEAGGRRNELERKRIQAEEERVEALGNSLQDEKDHVMRSRREVEREQKELVRAREMVNAAEKELETRQAALLQDRVRIETREAEIELLFDRCRDQLEASDRMANEAKEKSRKTGELVDLSERCGRYKQELEHQHKRGREMLRQIEQLEKQLQEREGKVRAYVGQFAMMEKREKVLEEALTEETKRLEEARRGEETAQRKAAEGEEAERKTSLKHREENAARGLELDRLASGLGKKEGTLLELQQKVVQQQEACEARRQEVGRKVERMEGLKRGLEEARRAAEGEKRELDARDKDLVRREGEYDERVKQVRQQRSEVEQLREDIRREQGVLRRLRAELDARQTAVGREEDRWEDEMREKQVHWKETKREWEKGMEEREARAQAREMEVEELRQQVLQTADDAARSVAELEEARAVLAKEREKLDLKVCHVARVEKTVLRQLRNVEEAWERSQSRQESRESIVSDDARQPFCDGTEQSWSPRPFSRQRKTREDGECSVRNKGQGRARSRSLSPASRWRPRGSAKSERKRLDVGASDMRLQDRHVRSDLPEKKDARDQGRKPASWFDSSTSGEGEMHGGEAGSPLQRHTMGQKRRITEQAAELREEQKAAMSGPSNLGTSCGSTEPAVQQHLQGMRPTIPEVSYLSSKPPSPTSLATQNHGADMLALDSPELMPAMPSTLPSGPPSHIRPSSVCENPGLEQMQDRMANALKGLQTSVHTRDELVAAELNSLQSSAATGQEDVLAGMTWEGSVESGFGESGTEMLIIRRYQERLLEQQSRRTIQGEEHGMKEGQDMQPAVLQESDGGSLTYSSSLAPSVACLKEPDS